MDANGLKFWLLSEEHHWQLPGDPSKLEYDAHRRSLRLARQRRELQLNEDRSRAEVRLEHVPQARDSFGNRAWYDPGLQAIMSAGADDTPVMIYRIEGTEELTDMAMGEDGVLYLALGGMVIMHDRRQRWRDEVVGVTGFTAWRLSPAPGGGVWVLDYENRQLAVLRGYPISDRAHKPYTPETVRPCNENIDPPRLEVLSHLSWPITETPVALACSLKGELALLSWVDEGEAVVRMLTGEFGLSAPVTLLGTSFPYSLAWVTRGRIAFLVCGNTSNDIPPEPKSEARVYPFGAIDLQKEPSSKFPSGDLYPVKNDYSHGPFLHGLDYPVHYPSFDGSYGLHRLSYPFYTREGTGFNRNTVAPLDSGKVDTFWHRLYIEAIIPRGCGIRLKLAATAVRVDPAEIVEADWFEHRFGPRFQEGGRGDVPVGCWSSLASELPHHPGLLPCERESGHNGLFTVLIQRAGRKVRGLRGRYLYVRVELSGPGNATPELFAVRAYAERFSYIDHYLPQFYRETVFSPEADDEGGATEADFLERFINNFEGILTNIEDRVAMSDLVTRPQTVPEEAIEWLADWIGFQFEAGWSIDRRRAFLAHAPELYQKHGTLHGLQQALDLVTDGAVSGGEIVVVEDYRLRRTFATILGADLDDRDDPLTLGGMENGNSFVGDTLFLGDKERREFLSFFAADLKVSKGEQETMDVFFDRLAFRVSILVRQHITQQDMGMIHCVAEREVPAHVEYRILPTSASLLVGISALVGVDTYLASRPSPGPARVDSSRVGRGDYVMGPATLDPRLEGIGNGVPDSQVLKPVAHVDDTNSLYGTAFTLDGSRSEAPHGRTLTSYHWSFLDTGEE